VIVTPITRPARHSATTVTSPAGVSSVRRDSGSRIGTTPHSSSTVATHMMLLPDIDG
jgi:hypothetical protein